MKVAIFGLGYVGSVMTAGLSAAGHTVIGVDLKQQRVDEVADGRSPVIEPGVSEAIAEGVAAGLVTATTDAAAAVRGAELSLVCVGTPPDGTGALDCSRVEAVCARIGEALTGFEGPTHTVVIRSTVMPGTTARCAAILAEATGAAPGTRATLLVNPEFLREGAGLADLRSAPMTLVGADDEAWAEPLKELYAFTGSPLEVTSPGVAELLKAVCNAWHATKVAFGNEVGRLCGGLGVDPHELMRLFVKDDKLNLGPTYLTPGFAYGGSCLPKDVGALGHLARDLHRSLPVIEAVPRSNDLHIELAERAIEESGCDRIGFLGLAFKPGTDDLRSSPLLDLVQRCLGKGLTVRIYDPNVQVASLVGTNREYALSRVRHLDELLVEGPGELLWAVDLVVLGHKTELFRNVCGGLTPDKQVLDLVRGVDPGKVAAKVTGLAW